jgi:hypothetical protein
MKKRALFIWQDDQAQGPMSENEVFARFRNGALSLNDQWASQSAPDDWHLLKELFPFHERVRRDCIENAPVTIVTVIALVLIPLVVLYHDQAAQTIDAVERNAISIAVYAVAGILGALILFAPARLAFQRRHKDKAAITVLNVTLGWTFIGWSIALVWAVKKS